MKARYSPKHHGRTHLAQVLNWRFLSLYDKKDFRRWHATYVIEVLSRCAVFWLLTAWETKWETFWILQFINWRNSRGTLDRWAMTYFTMSRVHWMASSFHSFCGYASVLLFGASVCVFQLALAFKPFLTINGPMAAFPYVSLIGALSSSAVLHISNRNNLYCQWCVLLLSILPTKWTEKRH